MVTSTGTFRFRDFELDVAAYELRRQGRPVKLERQPMELLILLVERRRQLVPRSEIIHRLWGKDVFVDVETGVNTAISKVRQALRDSIDTPAFVETVPGKGYRFIAAVDVVSQDALACPHGDAHTRARDRGSDGVMADVVEPVSLGDRPPRSRRRRRPARLDAARRRLVRGTRVARRAAVREPRERSRARISGQRPDRRDQRVARADRSRAPEREGPHAALQGQHEVGRRDRSRVVRGLSRGKFDSC